jgi:hypothetical protein
MTFRRFLLLAAVPATLTAQATPGRAALEKMHAAYAGKWYRTLTFMQKTSIFRPGQPERTETWWESLRYTPKAGVQLRIDRNDLAAGAGSLSSVDSTWIVRGGQLAQTRPGGNEFLPWIEGVYVQPVDVTEKQVREMGVDLTKTYARTFDGRPVTVIGAANASDTTSSQAWIDDERQVISRMIVAGAQAQPGLDVTLGDYVKAGNGWLATNVAIHVGGTLVQREQYSDWKVDLPLPDALFDPAQWTTAPHWGKKPV